MSSPTARSIAKLRAAGYIAGVVEKWIPQTKRRLDLFGFIDIIACRGREVLGVQTTTGANAAARLSKAQALPEYPVVAAAMRIEVHGWRKVGAKGKRKLWDCRVVVASEGPQDAQNRPLLNDPAP